MQEARCWDDIFAITRSAAGDRCDIDEQRAMAAPALLHYPIMRGALSFRARFRGWWLFLQRRRRFRPLHFLLTSASLPKMMPLATYAITPEMVQHDFTFPIALMLAAIDAC